MAFIKPVSFVSFGMFIIDEIEWQPPSTKERFMNLIGGAGTYAVLGARLASSPCQLLSRRISWIVDVGSDFPQEIKETIDKWNTDCIYRKDDSRLTTRAWNGYSDREFRSFKYITPKLRLDVTSLNDRQIRGKSFHMVCSPERCIEITTSLNAARQRLGCNSSRVVVWEPVPDGCSPDVLPTLHHALKECSIVSPNHDELKMFFPPAIAQSETQLQLVKRLLGGHEPSPTSSHNAIAIVREGGNGSTAYLRCSNTTTLCRIHLPAHHTAETASSIVDPTGAGNTYLGALAIALTDALHGQPTYPLILKHLDLKLPNLSASTDQRLQIENVVIAMIYATIAASFAIEQHGVPILKQTKVFTEIFEKWNGESFIERLMSYLVREAETVRAELVNAKREFCL